MAAPSQKATRLEYMRVVGSFLENNQYPTNSVLEISGKTKEWLSKFDEVTISQFPEVSADDLPYEDESFDCVIMNQVLEHCKKPWLCVEEAYRVLNKGGMLIASSPFMYQVHDWPGDFFRFTPEGLLCLTENAGFEEVLLKHRSGNADMVKHAIDHPNDRSSSQFLSMAQQVGVDKSLYFMKSTVVVRK